MKTRIMYTEKKPDGISGPSRIGRVKFSKSGKSVYYGGRRFQNISGGGFKANFLDIETGEQVWISGCKKNGRDRLYSGRVEIDPDVREEYWVDIRKMPENKNRSSIHVPGKYGGKAE